MRIAYFAPVWPPSGAANGVVTYVDTMRRQLTADGHQVHIISQNTLYAADGSEHELAPRGEPRGLWQRLVRRIDHRRGEHPIAALRLARQFKRARRLRPFDIIEMEESFGWSRAAQRTLDVPVVTRLHGPQFMKAAEPGSVLEQRQTDQRAAAERKAICKAAAVTAPTAATLTHTQSHYGRTLKRATVIPNPVAAHADADRWHGSREPGLILFVGRLDYLKGADTMLEAFALLARNRLQSRLVMVGPDAGLPLPDGRLLRGDDYTAWRFGTKVRERVTFAGTLHPDEIVPLRQRAALTVIASRHETFCFAAVEAMAAASPLVCTSWEGSSEVIRDGVTGWLTPVGAADQLAARIEWVLDHPGEAGRVGIAAWHRCREAYSPAAVGRQSVEFYAETLARHGRR